MGRSEYVQQYETLGRTDGGHSIDYLRFYLAVKNTNTLCKPP